MGLERRGNGYYYYKKQREGRRVFSQYVGNGAGIAEIFSMLIEMDAEQRELERHKKRQEREKAERFEAELSEIENAFSNLITACFWSTVIPKPQAANGEKKEMAKTELTKVNETTRTFEDIFAATNKKAPAEKDIEALRELMREDSSIWEIYGDWAKQTELTLLNDYFESSGLLLETVKKKLADLRDKFGWQDASEIEKLLIRQVCITWLRLYFVERAHHQATYQNHSLTHGIYWDKRLTMAQRRHLKAIESLTKVRRMMAQTAKLESAASKARSSQTMNSIKILEAMTKSE